MRIYPFSLLLLLLVSACSKAPQTEQPTVAAVAPVATAVIPAYPDIAGLSALLVSGDATSVALVAEAQDRVRKFAALNAFISLDGVGAVRQAAVLDRQRATGRVLGPLHGIPLVVKDNIHVAGMTNSAGTPALQNFVPTVSNEVVARLKAAGAIIIGKTNLHELAFGITSNNAAFGAVRNPYNPLLIPGGSSGGTAVAISSGTVAAGLGTDTGGSVRIPAALTGIIGFRPSTGRYPSDAITPISHTRDTVGLLARTVGDLVILDNVIVTPAKPLESILPGAIRLGVPRAYFYRNLDSETAFVIESVLARLGAAEVQLVVADIPAIAALVAQSAFPIALYEVAHDLPAYLETYATGVDFAGLSEAAASADVKGVLSQVAGKGKVSEASYAVAMNARQQLRKNYREYFASQQLDAVIFPTTLLPARPIASSQQTVELNGQQVPAFATYIHNTDPASIAALPAISLPAGLTASGLPVGIEIDGAEQSDRHLLAVAKTLERIIGFNGQPPSLP